MMFGLAEISIVIPGIKIEDGAGIGARSLATKNW